MPPPRAAAIVLDGPRTLLIKRFLRRPTGPCAMCTYTARPGHPNPACPGHHYAVLPGGGVEPGETPEEAALRELHEETTLHARIDRLLWTGHHGTRPASYFLMADVRGQAVLSGDEAAANSPDNSFELVWATADAFGELNLFPSEARDGVAGLLRG